MTQSCLRVNQNAWNMTSWNFFFKAPWNPPPYLRSQPEFPVPACPCFGHCLSPSFKQTWFSASRAYLNQLVAYSLLEHLIIVTSCVFKHFRSIWKLEKVYGPGAQPEFSSKEGWKKHTCFGWKHTLFGRQEGGFVCLNQKNWPQGVYKFPVPPWLECKMMCTQHHNTYQEAGDLQGKIK